ncbi:hypothetical protein MTO96_000221 [Rhipicephalus appendiculatus]
MVECVTPNNVLPALAGLEDLPALKDILRPEEPQDNVSSPVTISPEHSGEKDATPKDGGGTPRSVRGSKDTRSSVTGSKGGQGSIKGSVGTRGSSKGSKNASGSVQGSKGEQGSVKKYQNALASIKEGKDGVETVESSKAAPYSIEGSKGGGLIKGSKDASGSVKGSKDTQGSTKSKGTSGSVKGSKDTQGSPKGKGASGSVKGSKDTQGSTKSKGASGSVKGSKDTQGSPKGKGASGSVKGSKDTQGSTKSKGASGSVKGSKDTQGFTKSKGASGAVKDTKDTQGSTKSKGASGSVKDTKNTQGSTKIKDATGSVKGGAYVTGSMKRSNYALDSVKGTKGTKYESDSRNADESDQDRSHSSSKETQEAPSKVPMAVKFQQISLDEPGTPPPPAKSDHSLFVVGVAAFVAIILLLLLMLIMRGGPVTTHTSTTATCASEHCQKVAKLLLDSVAPDVNPCENFYLHVCGGWKYAGGQGEVLFQKLVEDVTFLIRTVSAPATGQSPTEKAALAYQACEDVVAKNNTNLTTLLQILEEAGFYSPPGWTGPIDALNATFYLHFRWRIAAPMKFTYVRHTDRGITLRMAPSESLKAYARRRKKPGYYDDLRKDYEFFQATFELNKLPNLTYDDWKKIDETIIADSEVALQEANSIKNFAGWNESTIQNAIRGVSRQQWTSILNAYLNRSVALRFYVDSLLLFKKFVEMPHDLGNAVAQAYYRWYMAEVLTRRVYAPWIVKDFPSFDEALKYHRGYCFAIIEQTASFALLASLR